MKKTLNILSAVLFLAVTFVTACTPYDELCYAEHPHQGNVRFGWNWKTVTRPDSMTVLAIRPTNLKKYAFCVNTTTDPNRQRYDHYNGIDYAMLARQSFPGGYTERLDHEVKIDEGVYDFLCYTAYGDAYTFDDEFFFKYSQAEFDSLRVLYNPYEHVTDHPDFNLYLDWVDRNPYSSYLLPTGPVHYCRMTNQEVKLKDIKRLLFQTSTMVSQQVTFVFYINKMQPGIRVDNVRCEISGIPGAIKPVEHEVDKTVTFKTLFHPIVQDTWQSTKTIKAECMVPVLGIVAPSAETVTTGPGILQVELLLTYLDENGKAKAARVRAAYNLYYRLNEKPSLIDTKDGRCVQNGQYLRIELKTPMEVDMDGLRNVSPGFDDWQELDVLNFDI